eukprot:TRINITY_DN2191_c0_g1_i1.p1 TRINITY_DN2191_c0_g1~~TRINITY_DN2191_c0_g1_i1.p1  ORF type:complete len:237 (-),score=82.32 TRINITY_DN2191_c0_g1_i1:272-982(-)
MTSNENSEQEAKEIEKKVLKLKSDIAENAQLILHKKMPEKIFHLSDLLKNTPLFNYNFAEARKYIEFNDVTVSGTSKKRKSEDDGTVTEIPSNKLIIDMLHLLKKEILELTEMINSVKLWIQLNIPRIEDGNNFGVGIQEETVSELGRVEESSFTLLESINKYFIHRAKLVSKLLKHPEIEDYKQSVIELDEKQYIYLRLTCLDLRNSFAILYDMITKNLDKIKTPRPHNHLNTLY